MYDREAALRDRELVRRITEGLDLNNPKDIERIYKEMQNGLYEFETEVGLKFDDQIYELHEKVLSGEIREPEPTTKKHKKIFRVSESDKSQTNKKTVSKPNSVVAGGARTTRTTSTDEIDDSKIQELIRLELKKRERRRKLLIVFAAIVAVGSLTYFGIYDYQYQQTKKQYQELAALKGSSALNGSLEEAEKNKFVLHKQEVVLPDILDEYATLFVKNNELIGWLKIDGTKIDYPVMQTADNDYYLSHNFNKDKDGNGCLFLDCSCTVFPRATNMIIYGHHMKSGNMFGNLQKYAKESYWREHSTIQFDTIYEKGTYEVMYAFYSKVYDNDDLVFKYYQFTNANSETEFNYYMNEMKALSLYDTGVTAEYGDTLLTLSTCDHSQTGGRFAVVAKRVYE